MANSLSYIQNLIKDFGGYFTVKTPDGKYVFANENWLKFTGFENQDVIGKTDDDLFKENVAIEIKKADAQAWKEEKPVEYVSELLREGAPVRIFALKLVIREANEKVPLLCTITETVENQEAVTELAKKIENSSGNIKTSTLDIRSFQIQQILFDHLAEGILVVNERNQITSVNRAAECMFGYEKDELLYQDFEILIPDRIRDRHRQHRLKYHEHPETRPMGIGLDLWAKRKNGTEFPVEISLNPFEDEQGRFVIALITNISVRKKQEQQLRAREQLFHLLIKNTPAAVAMFDNDMRYLAYSERWLKDLRVKSQDIVGLSHFDVFPEVPERWKELLRRGLAGENLKCEEDSFLRPDGHTDWLRWEIAPWYSETGEQGGIIVFSELLTEHKQMEEAVRKSDRRLRIFLQEVKVAFSVSETIKDEAGKIVDLRFIDVNPQAELEYGLPKEKIIGHLRSEVVGTLSEHTSNFLTRAISKNDSVSEELYVPELKKWYDATCYSAEPGQITIMSIDITARKQHEEEIKTAYSKLEKHVRELTTAHDEIRDFAFVSSHHLQEPLRKLQTYASILQKTLLKKANNKEQENFSRMLDAAGAARKRINDFILFTRLNVEERIKIPVSLDEILQKVIEELDGDAIISVLDELPVISADPDLIAQLFYNLVSNGLKFHKPNVQPQIKIYSKIVADPADPRNQLIEISFEDDGVGFDEKYADKLFHIFQKISTRSTGTGIGLATSRKICILHGGNLTAKSKGENGAIFTATLSVK